MSKARTVVGDPYLAGSDPETVKKIVRSKEWKRVFGSTTNINADTDHYAHPDSPVAYERVQGWLDAKAGLDPVEQAEHSGTNDPTSPYMEGYIGGRYGFAKVITASKAPALRKTIIARDAEVEQEQENIPATASAGRKIPRETTPEPGAKTQADLGIDNLDLGDNPGQRAKEIVVQRGKKTGVEYLIALDGNGDVIGYIEGQTHTTGMTKLLSAAIKDPTERIVIHHNHPNNGSLSGADIAVTFFPGLGSLYAHGHDGHTYRVAATAAGIDFVKGKLRLLSIAGVAAVENVLPQRWRSPLYFALQQYVIDNSDFLETAQRDVDHLWASILHDAGLIVYDTDRPASALIDIPEIKAAYDETVKELTKLLSGFARPDRPADTVRHPGDLEEFLERDGKASTVSGESIPDKGSSSAPAGNSQDAVKAGKNSTKAPHATKSEKKPNSSTKRFAKNKLFTSDKVEAARARLKSKMSRLNAGVDPETLIDGMTITGAYIEAGMRDFSDYAKRMIDDFGDGIRPYLLSFWEGARNYPGLNTDGMTAIEDAARLQDAGAEEEGIPSSPRARTIERDTTPQKTEGFGQDLGIDSLNLGDMPGDRARELVLEREAETGREYLIAIDEHGDVIANTEGTDQATGMTKILVDAMNSAEEKVVVHHNHPSGGSLSTNDILGTYFPGVHAVYAHSRAGNTYRAAATPAARRAVAEKISPSQRGPIMFQNVRPNFPNMRRNALQSAMLDHITAVPEARASANSDFNHLMNQALHDGGWITYTTNRDESTLLDIPEIKRGFDDTVAEFKATLDQHDAGDRHTDAIRHPGDLDGFPEEYGKPPTVAGKGRRDRGSETASEGDGDRDGPVETEAQPDLFASLSDRVSRPLSDSDRTEISDIIKSVSGLDDVEFAKRIDLPDGAPAWGVDAPVTAAGMYDAAADAVTIALDTGTDRTAYHEAFHRLQQLFLTSKERAALKTDASRLRRIVRSSEFRHGQVGGMSQKELEAEAFAIYATGRTKIKPYKGFQAAWDRINAALRRTVNWLAGRGFQTSEDIFERALAGEVVTRLPDSADLSDGDYSKNPIAPRQYGMRASLKTLWRWRSFAKLKAHPDYVAAKGGDNAAAFRLVRDAIDTDTIERALDAFGSDVTYVPVAAIEASGRNKLPNAVAAGLSQITGARVTRDIAQSNKAYHTGAGAMERLIARTHFDGPVQRGERYVIVDDVTVLGSTLADLANHIISNGGEVVGNFTLVNGSYIPEMVPQKGLINKIKRRFGDAIEQEFGIRPEALTASEARYLLRFRNADALRTRVAKARNERIHRLDAQRVRKGNRGREGQDYSVNPDRSPAPLTQNSIIEAINAKLTDLKPHMLATVPLNYFTDLARPNMTAVKDYLAVKRRMDTYRGKKHAASDEIAQRWLKYSRLGFGKDGKAKATILARLMHDSTLAGVDPSSTAKEHAGAPQYAALRQRYAVLPKVAQQLYRDIRDAYRATAEETDQILLDNVRTAHKIAEKQAEQRYQRELEQIEKSDKTQKAKKQAEKDARDRFKAERDMAGFSMRARLTKLRIMFESSRVAPPYFPLSRFGQYFVTVRGKDGATLSFSKRETKRDIDRLARQMKKAHPDAAVFKGLLSEHSSMRDAMDPRLVAEIEEIIGRVGLDQDMAKHIQDTIWQRYLSTMPDLSMRKKFIHRKGTAGFDEDALRGFSSAQFHSAHQNARLKYGMELQELLNDIDEQARAADDPIRGVQLANEMGKRHGFIMSPTGSRFAQIMTSTAFVWFLAVSPAAAIVNMSQTAMLGIPILGARFGSMTKAAAAIAKASTDSVAGKGTVTRANLTQMEKDALARFGDSGLIDRSQAHDLAGVGDTGVEYRPLRAKVMEVMSWAFHHAETWNREVTGLAAYRMARTAGQTHLDAVNTAHDLVWASHFDYSASNRPRFMQNDWAKVALVFRQHQINLLYRLARDVQQSFKGETPQARNEARRQLAGITGMMALMAGTGGVAGFNLMMTLAGLVFGDEDDPMEFEQKFKKDILDVLGPEWGGIVLNGVPGHYAGISLADRIGLPDLWFRAPNRDLIGKDEFDYWALSLGGASLSMVGNAWRGITSIQEGNFERGVEAIVPKYARDLLKAYRYSQEGVTDYRGNQILPAEEVSAYDILVQASGFTPAKIAETWERNSALKNAETVIMRKRQKLMNAYALAEKMKDEEARDEVLAGIQHFNQVPAHRAVVIKPKTLRQSLKTRRRNEARRVDGALIQNQRLGRDLREKLAEPIYR